MLTALLRWLWIVPVMDTPKPERRILCEGGCGRRVPVEAISHRYVMHTQPSLSHWEWVCDDCTFEILSVDHDEEADTGRL